MDHLSMPSPVRQVLTIALFELRKLFLNTRGIIALVAFALVWGLILVYPIKSASEILLNPSFEDLVSAVFGPNTLSELFQWKVAELAVLWCTALYLFPLFSIVITADQFASDKTRGTFRFLSLRVSRNSLFFGRFVGQIIIQFLLVSITVMATIGLASIRDPSLFLTSLGSGSLITINFVIILLPYTAIMAILSLYANTARQATIYAVIFWALISIIIAVFHSQFPSVNGLQWLLPGAQLSMMINTQGLGSLAYAPIPLIQTAVLLAIGSRYMQRIAL